MPELPDVERFKRYLDATSLYQRIADVEVRSAYVLKGISGNRRGAMASICSRVPTAALG